MNTENVATILPAELGYEPVAFQAPAVLSKVRIAPQQPTFIRGTNGVGNIVFKLPAAVSQLLLMHTIRLCFKFTSGDKGVTVDPAVGALGVIQRVLIRSNGVVLQDVQNQDRIYAWLMGVGHDPSGSEGITSLKRPKTYKGGNSLQNLRQMVLADPSYFENALRTDPQGASRYGVSGENARGQIGPVPVGFNLEFREYDIQAEQVGHYCSVRLWGGLFDYPYAMPLSLLRDLEIELTLNPALNFMVTIGQYNQVTGQYVYSPQPNTFTLEDIHLKADLMVLPDKMSQSINDDLTKGNTLSVPTLTWLSQFHSLNLAAGETRFENIVLNQTISSVRAIFMIFYQVQTDKSRRSTYCQLNPGQNGDAGGIFSAQIVVQGTSNIPQEAITNRTDMLRLYREALLQAGVNDFTLDQDVACNTITGYPQTLTGAGTFPTNLAQWALPADSLDAARYGRYRSDVLGVDGPSAVVRPGGGFALGFPLSASFANTNVLNGTRIEHNAYIRLGIKNAAVGDGGAQSYQVGIFFACQNIVRFSANGTADTLT